LQKPKLSEKRKPKRQESKKRSKQKTSTISLSAETKKKKIVEDPHSRFVVRFRLFSGFDA